MVEKFPGIINEIDENDDTFLHIAAKYDATGTLKFLIKKFPKLIENTNKDGDTVLRLLCSTNTESEDNEVDKEYIVNFLAEILEEESCTETENIKLLVKQFGKIIIESDEEFGYINFLNYAVEKSYTNIVKLLVNAYPELTIEKTDEYGRTALHIAALYDRKEIIEFLLNKFPGLKEKTDEDKKTARDIAGDKAAKLFDDDSSKSSSDSASEDNDNPIEKMFENTSNNEVEGNSASEDEEAASTGQVQDIDQVPD